MSKNSSAKTSGKKLQAPKFEMGFKGTNKFILFEIVYIWFEKGVWSLVTNSIFAFKVRFLPSTVVRKLGTTLLFARKISNVWVVFSNFVSN